MRRSFLLLASILTVVLSPAAVAAQTLGQTFRQLFTFGDCGQPLCLSEAVTGAHGSHYIPSVTQGEADMLGFMTGSIARSIANLPFTSTAGGVGFTFIDGALVATSSSYGGVFGERSQTLGRGRMMAGASIHGMSMDQLRGVPMHDLTFRFAHQNVGDADMGDPIFENDIIEVRTNMKVNIIVTSAFLSYGLSNNVDVGIQVPLVRASLSGASTAHIIPWDRETAPHQFGTISEPSEYADAGASGSAMGIGDIALRVKANAYQTTNMGLAFTGDLRLPTGSEEDFLGSGEMSLRLMAIASAKSGDFSPHLNAGMAIRSGDRYGNSFVAALGFDHLLAESVTMAVDVLVDHSLGDSELTLPGSVEFTEPVRRKVTLTDIPEGKDHLVDLSFGFKFQLPRDYRVITNLLVPMSEGGMRPRFMWTTGFERTF
jgi:hypothetical protein